MHVVGASRQDVYNNVCTISNAVGWTESMCEFTVILDGKAVFKDAVHAKTKERKIIVTDAIGESKEFKNCKIIEVDVNSTRLVLSSL
jgi:predicted RNA-binding protein